MAYPSILRFTRPRTFLYVMSLRTGTELITLTLLVNKLTGVYGVLALFTGFRLSYMQLSMYIYSIFALLLTAWLAPHIRKQSPLQCLALAWFYALDSAINALYTVAFAASWFLVLAEHNAAQGSGGVNPGPGKGMMDDTAGFTNPSVTVSRVEVVPTSHPSATSASAVHVADGAALVGHDSRSVKASPPPTPGVSGMLGDTILQSGSIASITVISALWIVRVYFILVIMAYARGVLRQHIVLSTGAGSTAGAGTKHTPLPRLNTAAAGSTSATPTPLQQPTSTAPAPAQNTPNDTPVAGANTASPRTATSYPSYQADFKPSADPRRLPSPFTPPSSLSAGWPGKLGRLFVSVFPSYWLGPANEAEEHAIFGSGMAGAREMGSTPGVFERERRRRAGTGPPMLKPIELERVRK